MTIRKLDAFNRDISTIIVYGDAGAGKTRIASTLPGNVLIIDGEGGLAGLPQDMDNDRFSIATPASFDEMRKLINDVDGQYDWIVVDSLTSFSVDKLHSELLSNKDGRKAYGEMGTSVISEVRAMAKRKSNFLLTCHLDSIKDERTMKKSFGPSMPGNVLKQDIKHWVDAVFPIVVNLETGERGLRTSSTPDYYAKVRTSVKLNDVEPADLTEVIKKINAKQ